MLSLGGRPWFAKRFRLIEMLLWKDANMVKAQSVAQEVFPLQRAFRQIKTNERALA